MRWLIPLLLAVCFAVPANAQRPLCLKHDDMVAMLKTFGEEPVSAGISNTGPMIEIFASPDGSTWSLVVSGTDGMACMTVAGEGWRDMKRVETGPRA